MAFLGMRGTGDWATDQRPKNWRETILRLYPNGTAPLTAIMSKLRSESTNDPEFNWWTKTLSTQRSTLADAGLYTTSALSTAYSSGTASAGDTLYAKIPTTDAAMYRIGHQVLLRDASDFEVDVNAKITSKGSNYLGCTLLEDDGSGSTHDLSDADTVLIVGNINAEGAVIPDAISYNPVKWYNLTQIFRTPLDITRTARKTRLRTGDAYKELKREALEYHSIEMEKAFIFGVRTEGTGSNGKPERTTGGLIRAISDGGGLTESFSGTWSSAGEDWIDEKLEYVFRYGSKQKLAFAGSGALLGINKIIKAGGQFTFTSKTKSYGIEVTEWVTPFGTINIILHPLFSLEPTNRQSMVIFEPENLIYRFISDTSFYAEGEKQNTGHGRYDATKEEFLTECGLEYHHPSGWAYLNNVGG